MTRPCPDDFVAFHEADVAMPREFLAPIGTRG
jgi:hypothetical protein